MLQAGQDVLLVQVAGVNEQQTELFVGLIGGVLLDDLGLLGADLARFGQHAEQRPILVAELGMDQLALAKGNPRGDVGSFERQRAGLSSKVHQVEDLKNAEVA